MNEIVSLGFAFLLLFPIWIAVTVFGFMKPHLNVPLIVRKIIVYGGLGFILLIVLDFAFPLSIDLWSYGVTASIYFSFTGWVTYQYFWKNLL